MTQRFAMIREPPGRPPPGGSFALIGVTRTAVPDTAMLGPPNKARYAAVSVPPAGRKVELRDHLQPQLWQRGQYCANRCAVMALFEADDPLPGGADPVPEFLLGQRCRPPRLAYHRPHISG